MSRSSAISLVLLLAASTNRLEGKANQEDETFKQEIYVRIYDYAQVSPDVLAEAKRVTSSILRKIRVEISWSDHSFGGRVEGNFNGASVNPKLQLRILNQQMARRLPVNKAMTGLTFQGTAGQPGKVANVFYHRVEELAKSMTCSTGEILGHAAAHELGHLLLGNLDHPATGLMKARLEHEDLQRAAKGDLLFTKEEAALIRRAISGR